MGQTLYLSVRLMAHIKGEHFCCFCKFMAKRGGGMVMQQHPTVMLTESETNTVEYDVVPRK